jgi:hypothetical protein
MRDWLIDWLIIIIIIIIKNLILQRLSFNTPR